MKEGGTVLFDTRDQFSSGLGDAASPATMRLREIVEHLNVPPLEPVPPDHVLTKSFYILGDFPGRFNGSPLWVEASLDAGEAGFGYFEFAYVGVFLLAGTILLALALGARLLPVRENRALPPDLSRHARTLVEQFRLADGVHQLRVRPESPLVGRPRPELDLGERPGVTLLTLQDGAGSGAARLGPIEKGDLIAVRADAEAVAELAADLVLSPADAEGVEFQAGLFTSASGHLPA